MDCHEVTTNESDSAGKHIKKWICYCKTTACLKNRIQNYNVVQRVELLKKDPDCDCLMEWQLVDPNNPCKKCSERMKNWYKKFSSGR